MPFSSVIRSLIRSPLTDELENKLVRSHQLTLSGLSRVGKGIVSSILSQKQERLMLVIAATIEEAGRWSVQLETMGWQTVHFYPTSDVLPYEPYSPESEIIWGQMQVLSDLVNISAEDQKKIAIVATDRALQPHLPSPTEFKDYCISLEIGSEISLRDMAENLTLMGYEHTSTVETEGQWAKRGDIIDIFPVSSEMPVRIDWFGDEIERIREFEPSTQRPLDSIASVLLTPLTYAHILGGLPQVTDALDDEFGIQGFAVHPRSTASILDYLPDPSQCLVVIDELDQCRAHCDRWYESAEAFFPSLADNNNDTKLHRSFNECLLHLQKFDCLDLWELAEENRGINMASRPVPVVPHQFGKIAQTIREYREQKYKIILVSAQPSRTVALLQEHDCQAQFIPNVRDYPAIEKTHNLRIAVALKYSGIAEIQGFVLPTYRIAIISDREFFGQHALGTPNYVRKRRRAVSKQVDLNKLSPGDYVVHKSHGVGQFLKLEKLTVNHETREYLVLKYADGILRVVVDQMSILSRYRGMNESRPELHKMTGKAWTNATNKAKKAVKKIAFDLLELYAKRAQQVGYAFPPDNPWQQEVEDSFPYQATPDQLKATQDVKQDMESSRPMDRLVCGDVGFGKTEVAIRTIFKAVTSGKQAALLVPTTILAQQHYHSLQERYAAYPVNIALLNRFKSNAEKKEIIRKLKTGELDIVVGTHQLLAKDVEFKDLGLLVIDEEQRFGVAQKEKIKTMKTEVDVLTLSATPIPRTLYMAMSGVREMSLITTPPPSRRSIMTHLSRYNSELVRAAIRQELDRNGQVFYVVSRIDDIEKVAERVNEMLPSVRIAIAHGQMPESELETTMLSFNSGEADMMICTTIIESGLDIPRVNTIIIEDAQRFGLSQLYQLRGRVGRAGIQAHAWLFYQEKGELTDVARQRLKAIQEFTHLGSGYQLAMRDMEIRGVGNILGSEQSGQINTIGFDLYMEMLQDAIAEIRGSEIPEVDDTQVDLPVTAFIPAEYIADSDRKMSAYRAVASVNSRRELAQIIEEWNDCYGNVPTPAMQLIKVMELKLIAKKIGFSRIKSEGKQHVVLESKMEEPAWKLLHQQLPSHLQSRFVYNLGNVTVRGLGTLSHDKQLDSLIEWLDKMYLAKAEA
ncbi:transcription-repair coupling factor [Pseudanabaena mucicola]|uniref:Transcription-repair-coupling factor n=1 Tax=Pseudanabaena mucicola FACHB-723 TaxID=2692860 RepID=A0ABR7ZXU6_9CYAN|nr:transcription-repair coupling factor [Pseudanabaena mucicola]MBD2188687.1 transcription-repair coupling factor [Pseudanabaena mucicola FACHB-723]